MKEDNNAAAEALNDGHLTEEADTNENPTEGAVENAAKYAVESAVSTQKAGENDSDAAQRAAKRLFIIRIIAVAVAVLGLLMLISGIALRRLEENSRITPEKAQMPEEYIEEFFSDENFVPNIEDFIEPEA